MTVVVTGAAGFIGRVLVRRLLAAGRRVVAVDRLPIPPAPGLCVLIADLLDEDPAVGRALSTADQVFHLAARAGVRGTGSDADRLRHRDNVVATRYVLELLNPAAHLVFTSSSSVYGGSSGRASSERDPVMPRGGYAHSKVAAERLCAQRAAAGASVTVARPFTVVGEGQRPDMAFHRWVRAALAGAPLVVFGSCRRSRDFTDVREVARALVALGDRRFTGTVNIGSGQPRTLAAAIAAIGRATGVTPTVRVVSAPVDEVAHTWADTTTLARVAGFVPQLNLTDVARRVVAGVRPHATEEPCGTYC